MPTLHWIGKEKVVNHHLDVPFRTLKAEYTIGDAEAARDNLIIHGDNLEALKALLPQYEGRVKVVCIDPPYNTGNESWVYNDNVNDPKIKKWLGQVVGKEGEDLSRHDKWLCMMYPRLKLLHRLLRDDGSIWVCIDDSEVSNLRIILDEIFGQTNFLASIAWEKRYTRSNNANLFYSLKDTILVYRKTQEVSQLKEARTDKADANYSNTDSDPRGPWMTSSYVNPATKEKRKNLVYTITAPDGREVDHPTHAWKYSPEEHRKHKKENRLWWGLDGAAGYPRLKNFLLDAKGMVPTDLWYYEDTGTTDIGGLEIKFLFGSQIFDTPKPTRLIERILQISSNPNSSEPDIILDSFAGSGTTAHAVLKLNQADGGNRRFIMIEMEDYAETITAERVRRVISGYGPEDKPTPGTGGGFSYLTLGPTVFAADGKLNPDVADDALRQYLWYAETKTALPKEKKGHAYLLGSCRGISYYFYYVKGEETTLDYAFLKTITERDDQYVIYADACALDADYLKGRSIQFKKIPRDVPRY